MYFGRLPNISTLTIQRDIGDILDETDFIEDVAVSFHKSLKEVILMDCESVQLSRTFSARFVAANPQLKSIRLEFSEGNERDLTCDDLDRLALQHLAIESYVRALELALESVKKSDSTKPIVMMRTAVDRTQGRDIPFGAEC